MTPQIEKIVKDGTKAVVQATGLILLASLLNSFTLELPIQTLIILSILLYLLPHIKLDLPHLNWEKFIDELVLLLAGSPSEEKPEQFGKQNIVEGTMLDPENLRLQLEKLQQEKAEQDPRLAYIRTRLAEMGHGEIVVMFAEEASQLRQLAHPDSRLDQILVWLKENPEVDYYIGTMAEFKLIAEDARIGAMVRKTLNEFQD